MPLVVTPEAALCECALKLLIVTLTLRFPSTKSTDLSSEFAAELTTAIKTNSLSVVKRKAEFFAPRGARNDKLEELKERLSKKRDSQKFNLEPENFSPEVTVKHFHTSLNSEKSDVK